MSLIHVLVYGFFDSLNPCNLSTMVIFAALLGWARRRHLPVKKLGWSFIVFAFTSSYFFSIGGLMNILYSIPFFKSVRYVYAVLGVVFIIYGIVHFADWLRIRKANFRMTLPVTDDGKGKPFSRILASPLFFMAAVVLSAIATIWPPNKFISFYSNYVNVPGETKSTLIMLGVYNLVLVVPVGLAMLWIPWASPNGWAAMNLSKTKVILSSFLLGLGICLVYIFR